MKEIFSKILRLRSRVVVIHPYRLFSVFKSIFFLQVTVAVLVLVLNASAFAANAILSWDSNLESDLSGYKVYFGPSSGSYGTPIDVGNVTSYTISGLSNGTHYFAVTALDTSGNESGFSSEVSKTFSTDDTSPGSAASGGGGCGIIRPGGGKPPNPGDAVVMLTLMGLLALMLLKKGVLKAMHAAKAAKSPTM